MTPDWAAAPEAVPYANFFNPQTLNLYAMVANNPESFADLDGHLPELAAPGGGLTPDGQLDDCGDDQQKCGAQDQSQLSHLVPTPKGTNCSQKGVICENDGKSKRVGDYDGDKFCNASGCFVWHGDGNGHGQWLALPFDQLKKDLEALSELELLGSKTFSKYSQRVFIAAGMVAIGTGVAEAGVEGTIEACATVAGCIVSPITGGVAVAGAGLALEGVYYGLTGTILDPSTGKSCGANGCN